MTEATAHMLKITVIIFMAGQPARARAPAGPPASDGGVAATCALVTLSLVWAFVLCPALAYALGVVFR